MLPQIQPADFLAIIPEIGLTLLAFLVMIYDLVWPKSRKRNLGFLTAGGVVVILVLLLTVGYPDGKVESAFGGMVRHDLMSVVFQTIFLVAAAITSILSVDFKGLREGEYFAILLISTLGMSLMASSTNLIMLYIALETTSISAYVLVGYLQKDDKSTEAGLKYFLFGAFASAVLLYGLSLLYGFTGTADIYQIAQSPALLSFETPILVSAVLIIVGLGFKISAVPSHS